MNINLLLDNCIFIQIISKTEFSPALRQLKFLVFQNYVTLLVPDILIIEWNNHRERLKKDIDTAFRDQKNEVKFRRILQEPSAEFLQERIDEAVELLQTQIDTVDEILSDHCVKIKTTPELLMLIRDQKARKKMPFWSAEKDNHNDAELIFSTLSYLREQGHPELYFVSANIKEFAHDTLPGYILHPDISERFPAIKIHYYTQLSDAYKVFDELDIPRYKKEEENSFGKIKSKIVIDETRPLLDQLSEYMEKRFKDLSFIPKRLFLEHYPFIKGTTFNYYHRPFTVVTNNKEVYNLLSKIKIRDGVVISDDSQLVLSKEDETKVTRIFHGLAQNNIYKVAFEDQDEIDIIFDLSHGSCNCAMCLYNRMDWAHLIAQTQFPEQGEQDRSIEGQLRVAYGQYKVGNYHKAALLLQKLYNEQSSDKTMLNYIIQFNLKHLAPLLRSHYWNERDIMQLAGHLSKIDLDSAYKKFVKFEDVEILDWLHNKAFTSDTLAIMHEKVNQITDHFYGQNTGFNNNTLSLMEQYVSTEAFLFKNSIIYDYYSDFDMLTNLLTQGMLASYGCNPLLSGKLNYFTNHYLKKILLSGKAEVIQKYLIRYKLKNVKYLPEEGERDAFTDVIQSLIKNYPLIEKSYTANEADISKYFWHQYSEVLFNALTLMAMVDLKPAVLNKLAEIILELLQSENQLHLFRTLKHLKFFFNRKHSALSDQILQRYYLAAIRKKEFHSDRFFELLVQVINERGIRIHVTDSEFQVLKENFLSEPPKDQTVNSWFEIGYFFSSLAANSQKDAIVAYAKKSLEEKFEPGKYYLAMMFDMIEPDGVFNNMYHESIEAVIEKGPQKRPFENKEYYIDSRIDNYLNFCLKYSIAVPQAIREKIPVMGAYYRWLFDMEGFDYSNFNTGWLYNHFTLYFKLKFRECKQLKTHLLKLIRSDPDTELERIFVIIYCFDD